MATKRHLRAVAVIGVLAIATTGIAGDDDVTAHMHEHYGAVLSIQAAVIAGSLESTRASARWLVEHEAPAGLPEDTEEHVAAMRKAAADVLAAEDIPTAAAATAQLGLSCGNCHVASEVEVQFADPGRPNDGEKIMPHMARHQWAADRMWEGLIGPSEFAWRRGGDVLFESPIRHVDHEGEDEEWKGMARRIHQLAANATTVFDMEQKAGIYGEFIANCAACHQKLEQGPGQ